MHDAPVWWMPAGWASTYMPLQAWSECLTVQRLPLLLLMLLLLLVKMTLCVPLAAMHAPEAVQLGDVC